MNNLHVLTVFVRKVHTYSKEKNNRRKRFYLYNI